MGEWREPTEAEVEDALVRVPQLSRDPALARERAVRFARAEAWQRDRGLVPLVGEMSRGDGRRLDKDGAPTKEPGARVSSFERTTALRGKFFSSVKGPPDGVTYGAGKKRGEK